MPATEEEIAHVMRPYEERGFPGCVGSIDCVHLIWDKCPAGAYSACKGKGSFPTLAFQAVCSNTKKTLSVSQFFFGSVNDKTIAMSDQVRCNVLFHLFHISTANTRPFSIITYEHRYSR